MTTGTRIVGLAVPRRNEVVYQMSGEMALRVTGTAVENGEVIATSLAGERIGRMEPTSRPDACRNREPAPFAIVFETSGRLVDAAGP